MPERISASEKRLSKDKESDNNYCEKKKTKTVKAQVDKIKCEIKKPKILEGWIV